jgi:hypothetical protein
MWFHSVPLGLWYGSVEVLSVEFLARGGNCEIGQNRSK